MTIAQMEAIATDLDKRVSALEDRREPASFAPQNSFYIDQEGKTVDGSAIHQAVDSGGSASFRAETHNQWNALPATEIASVEFEVITPQDLIRIYGLLEADWVGGSTSVWVDAQLDGVTIATKTVTTARAMSVQISTVGNDAQQLLWIRDFRENGGGVSCWETVVKTNGPNSWSTDGFLGSGVGLLVEEGPHTLSLRGRVEPLGASNVKEAIFGWDLTAVQLAVSY